MKYTTPILIVSIVFLLSGCCSPSKVIIEHREIPSSLPAGSILRVPRKIAYLDEGNVPSEVLALAIQYQKIRETGRLRDMIALEFPGKSPEPDEVARRTAQLITQEAREEPALLILQEIEYSADPKLAKIRSENWQFNFKIVGYHLNGDSWVTFSRTGNGEFRLLTN
jgi:hypothetical protein